MIYDKSLPIRVLAFCSAHYWRIFGLSLLLLFVISYHKVFPLLTHPVIVNAITADEQVAYTYHYRSRISGKTVTEGVMAPMVEFDYEGKHYRIMGGSDEGKGAGLETKVIFNESNPGNACEFSIGGLFDFPVFYITFRIWFLLSALFFGVVTLDKHFSIFAISIKTLTPIRAIIFAALILLIPFIKNGRELLLGNKTEGLITDEVLFADDGSVHRAVAYQAEGKEYKFAAEGAYNDESGMIGRTIPVLYDITKPQNACIYDYKTIYDNNWLIITGIGLVFLSGWFFATRIPNDEGTMDEYH